LELIEHSGCVWAGSVVEGQRDLAAFAAGGGDEWLAGEESVDRGVLSIELRREGPGSLRAC
jgi:hypothetical protein